jgi:ABC-type polysaccharide/polyol phosphate export permease
MIALLCIMLILGVAIPPTLPLILVPTLLLLVFGIGLGMIVAPFAVRFPDLLDFERVGLFLIGYLVPVFYPFAIVPERYRIFEQLNPIYYFVGSFRATAYGDSLGTSTQYAVMVGSAFCALLLGAFVFSRMRRSIFAAL